ncbi:MAG: UvrD-helicase domain-containing protein [Deltaproteobacteria bacterium]|nr:UvrD-helicase domain-containing protein [Deltaproteobacteria bacterium]
MNPRELADGAVFYADLHIHSRFSRATAKGIAPETLACAAAAKGLAVIGTGDLTHPEWLRELEGKLEPAGNGFYRLKGPVIGAALAALAKGAVPPAAAAALGLDPGPGGPGRAPLGIQGILGLPGAGGAGAALFTPTGEISCIYKQGGRARKIHLVVWCPTLEGARAVSGVLGALGNVRSDGRPILGLSARDAVEAVLTADPAAQVIPAHVWTPWFSLFGSMSGFDDPGECFLDLAGEIRALETGLSSDPYMNRLVSRLDPYALVSSSDAHSPDKLGREATVIAGPPDVRALAGALRGGPELLGTVEFFPEEGKYHLDGHAGCGPAMTPEETRRLRGICPACGKPLTVGVLNRVMELADRQAPPEGSLRPDWHILPLREIAGQCLGRGPGTVAAREAEGRLLAAFGSEYGVLLEASLDDLEAAGGTLLRLAIQRMREGRVTARGGYDGVFGTVEAVGEEDRREHGGPQGLFGPGPRGGRSVRKAPVPDLRGRAGPPPAPEAAGTGSGLSPAVAGAPGPDGGAGRAEPAGTVARAAPAGTVPGAGRFPGAEPPVQGGLEFRRALPRIGDMVAPGGLLLAGPSPRTDGPPARPPLPFRPLAPLPPLPTLPVTFGEGYAQPATALFPDPAPPLPGAPAGGTDCAPALPADSRYSPGAEAREATGTEAGGVPAPAPPVARDGLIRRPDGTFFEELNEAQLHCATFGGNSLLVAAGPGSGKTRVLLARSLWLMDRGIALPGEMLLTTFTRKAAEAIADRLAEARGGTTGIRVGTLHSMALDFLRKGGEEPRLASGEFLVEVAAEAVKGTRISPKNLLSLVSRLKNLALPLATGDPREDRAIAEYGGALVSAGLMDFDDLVAEAARLSSRGLRSGFRAVLADEAQDLSPLEYGFLKALAGEASLTAIGDPAQCIYGFRGALPSLEDALHRDRPDLQVSSLALNYRSTPVINAASELFRRHGGSARISALASGGAGRRIVRAQLDSPLTEAVYVARRIKEHLGGLLPGGSARGGGDAMEGLTLGDIAVIYRLRVQGQEILKTLLEEGIPCQISGDDGESAQDGLDLKAEKVSLLTIHAAKGLEFRLVFVTGLDEGLCPYSPPSEVGAGFDRTAEEERLFYVALTRAKELLYLTRVRHRRIHGRVLSGRPSPFWERIPAAVAKDVTARTIITVRPAPLF